MRRCRVARRAPARRIVEFAPGQPFPDAPAPPPPQAASERAGPRQPRSLPRGMMRAAGLGSPVRRKEHACIA